MAGFGDWNLFAGAPLLPMKKTFALALGFVLILGCNLVGGIAAPTPTLPTDTFTPPVKTPTPALAPLEDAPDESAKDARVAHVTLVHDAEHPSYLELPIVE
jgi:hypothetical protein